MQKSALSDHQSSSSHIAASKVINQSVAMIKHVEKSQVACNEALKTQLKVVLHMAQSHLYSDLAKLLQSAGCHNLKTITSAIDDRIANSRYVGILIDETTNVSVEKMLTTYLTLEDKGEPETVFIGNYEIPYDTAECIAAKIKKLLSGRGVSMAQVVGFGSDGANVMVGRKAGVAQLLRDCPLLVNIHCGAHRMALAAHNASAAVPKCICDHG